MASETDQAQKIPVIDFSIKPLKPETPEWESVRNQVRQALEEFGCFEALFDKIPMNTQAEMFEAMEELFDLPSETKKLNVSNKPFLGYSGYKTQELMTIEFDHAKIGQEIESFAQIGWPQGNPSFCKAVRSYSEPLSELDQIIRRMIFESLGIEKYYEEHMESTNYLYLLRKYKEPEICDTKQLAVPAHTDKGFMSIMSQNQVDAFEVQSKDGQWISVKPSPGSFVVVLGEALSLVLSNGRLHAPLHRVMMSGKKIRYAAGFYSNPKEDYLIKTPEEMVDEEHPLKFKPYHYYEYLKSLMTYTRKPGQTSFEVYCGI